MREEQKLEERLKKTLPDVYAHGERVALYAETIAREMGLGESKIGAIKEAALLHDIGKLFVSPEIMNKPGALTDAEKAAVDKHASVEVLSLLDFDSPFVRYVAEYHHTDSSRVLPECQMIAAADVFDALTSPRPYRRALSPDEALEIMRTSKRNAYLNQICVNVLASVFSREMYA